MTGGDGDDVVSHLQRSSQVDHVVMGGARVATHRAAGNFDAVDAQHIPAVDPDPGGDGGGHDVEMQAAAQQTHTVVGIGLDGAGGGLGDDAGPGEPDPS